MKLTNNDFMRLKTFMYNNYGINLENKRTLIETRLAMVVKKLGFNEFKSSTLSISKSLAHFT